MASPAVGWFPPAGGRNSREPKLVDVQLGATADAGSIPAASIFRRGQRRKMRKAAVQAAEPDLGSRRTPRSAAGNAYGRRPGGRARLWDVLLRTPRRLRRRCAARLLALRAS